jgi:ribosome biogenesis GTPase
MALRLADGTEVRGRIKGKKLQPVCGDRVYAMPIHDEPEWLITSIVQRQNELTRPDSRGRIEVLAANLSCIAVVAADSPPADWYLVDRYLAAAENMTVPALVVFNKTDQSAPATTSRSALLEYQKLCYKTITCSAKTGENLDQIDAALRDNTVIVVGQSGVGKSSIINSLVAGMELRVAEVSASTGEGKHTTVNSIMLDLPNGGVVIDSPGVRDYAPAIAESQQVIRGFREIAGRGQECRFANCNHLREPDCAVKFAVTNDEISARRYESYKRLLALSEKLAARY